MKYSSDDEQVEEVLKKKRKTAKSQVKDISAVTNKDLEDAVGKAIEETTSKECQFINQHKEYDMVPMKEETHDRFINHSLVLHNEMRAKCLRGLVKSKRASRCNEQIHAVFNNK